MSAQQGIQMCLKQILTFREYLISLNGGLEEKLLELLLSIVSNIEFIFLSYKSQV